jgi:hypothetical protein
MRLKPFINDFIAVVYFEFGAFSRFGYSKTACGTGEPDSTVLNPESRIASIICVVSSSIAWTMMSVVWKWLVTTMNIIPYHKIKPPYYSIHGERIPLGLMATSRFMVSEGSQHVPNHAIQVMRSSNKMYDAIRSYDDDYSRTSGISYDLFWQHVGNIPPGIDF